MRNPTGWTLRAFVVVLLATPIPAAPAARSVTAPDEAASVLLAQDAGPAKCCFTNPGYTGTCEVQPAKDESCGQILLGPVGRLGGPELVGAEHVGHDAQNPLHQAAAAHAGA